MNNFEEYLSNSLDCYKDNVIKEAMIYCLEGGKRFRPNIMFSIVKGFGLDESVAYGARNVLISMAGEGAVLVSENGDVYTSTAPKGKLVNSVGAGDSMVAGFIYGYTKFNDYKEAFKYGVSTGSASAFSEFLATKDEVENLYRNL